VNTFDTSLRYRVCSGGSTTSIDGGSTGPIGRRHWPNHRSSATGAGTGREWKPTPNASLRSTAVATSCRAVANRNPPVTIGPRSRIVA
jgi:hypothetical protein